MCVYGRVNGGYRDAAQEVALAVDDVINTGLEGGEHLAGLRPRNGQELLGRTRHAEQRDHCRTPPTTPRRCDEDRDRHI
jgi:hypothetical protein